MSLLAEFESLLEETEDLRPYEIEYSVLDVEEVSNEYQVSSRWSEHWTAVFKRGDEYVALDYEVPATEYQEGSEFESGVYAVRPYEVTVTKYKKI